MRSFILILLLFIASEARAGYYLNVQHSGYAGNIAVGAGYAGSSLGIDLLHGWTPKSLAGQEVRSWTLKGLWYLFALGDAEGFMVRPYIGLGAVYSHDPALFLMLPDQYPDAYYVPSALRPTFSGGLRVQLNESFSGSIEYVLLDSELAFVKNKGGISYDQVGSVGFALHYRFY